MRGSAGAIRASLAKRLKKSSSGPNTIEGLMMMLPGKISVTAISPSALLWA
jgi:hypothetical protein